jgi:hypothetical protein
MFQSATIKRLAIRIADISSIIHGEDMKHRTRAIRIHHRRRVIRNRLQSAAWLTREGFPDTRTWSRARGRCATLSPHDCGKPHCPICHPHKADPNGNDHLRKADRILIDLDREIQQQVLVEYPGVIYH